MSPEIGLPGASPGLETAVLSAAAPSPSLTAIAPSTSRRLLQALKLIGQAALLWGTFRFGTFVVERLHLPVPGSVVGMITLFLLLCLGVVRPAHVQELADLLLKHLAFFFIPLAVGLMTWGALIASRGLVLLAALCLSTAVALGVTGVSVQLLHRAE
jgi:holin-like protein